MTVHELIQELLKIPNQEQEIAHFICAYSPDFEKWGKEQRKKYVAREIGYTIVNNGLCKIDHIQVNPFANTQTFANCMVIDYNLFNEARCSNDK